MPVREPRARYGTSLCQYCGRVVSLCGFAQTAHQRWHVREDIKGRIKRFEEAGDTRGVEREKALLERYK